MSALTNVPLNVTFTNASTNATSYSWVFGDGNTSTAVNPTDIYNTSGSYTVVLTANNGACSDTATAIIVINDNTSIIIPNVFTPNNDGVNDVFFLTCVGINTLHADIFNRWGERIYSFDGPQGSWDGKNSSGQTLSNGTYYVIIRAVGFDGKEIDVDAYVGLFK